MNSFRPLIRLAGTIRDAVLRRGAPEHLSSPEYAERFGAKWHKVLERATIERPAAVHHGSLRADLNRRLDPEFPEIGVLETRGATVYGPAGWVFSNEGHLLSDHSWYGRHYHEMRNVPRHLPAATHLRGTCLSLASDFAVGGYGHFVTDSLARLDIFNRAGFCLDKVDHIICPKPTRGNARRLFEQSGIPEIKCIWADELTAVRPDTLLASSFPGARRNYPHWVPKFLQKQFLPLPPLPKRRLYISRAGYKRNPANQEAVIAILLKYGFEIYDPMLHEDSHRDFSEATIVVGASGSGLTGLAFCQPGTKVLELVPTDHVHPYYYTLSEAAGLDYGCLVCRSATERGPDSWGPSTSDFHVDEVELDTALAILTDATRQTPRRTSERCI